MSIFDDGRSREGVYLVGFRLIGDGIITGYRAMLSFPTEPPLS